MAQRDSVLRVTSGHRGWMLAAVAVGGALGTMARYELALAEPVGSDVPVGHVRRQRRRLARARDRGRGVGGPNARRPASRGVRGRRHLWRLTTFSTWMVESVLLTRDGDGGLAAVYLVVKPRGRVRRRGAGVTGARRVLHRPGFRVRPGAGR